MVRPGAEAEEDGREPRLDDRIVRRMQSRSGHVSFNGLRRSLSVHPESLSRALRRLERFGVVLHDEAGYALAEGPSTDLDAGVRPAFREVGGVELPPETSVAWVLGEFAGRWFRDLRWEGMMDGAEEPWLIWSVPGTERHVFLTLKAGRLCVGTDGGTDGGDRGAAAARTLLASGLERLGRQGPRAAGGARAYARLPVPSLPN